MLKGFADVIKTTNSFVILLNGKFPRVDPNIHKMLTKLEAVFGKEMWNHVILGVSFWSYKDSAIMERTRSGKTEEWLKEALNTELQEKFNIGREVDAVFIDSWAKQPFNLNDTTQQKAFDRETKKLWNIFHKMKDFEFKGTSNACI